MTDDFFSSARARAAHGQDRTSRDRKSQGRFVLGVALAFFLLGGAATGAVLWQTGILDGAETPAEPQQVATLSTDPEPTPEPAETATAQDVREVARQTGGIDSRVAALEQRLSRLDLQAEAAAGNAARAEGLLIAFAVRRALERGDGLGYLADQLRLRFGEAQPNAVATIIDFSRNPIRIEELQAELAALENDLGQTPSNEGFWDMLGREASSLFVFRRDSAPSPQPVRRFERAEQALEEGRIGVAIGEVRAMPNARIAGEWLAEARRYAQMREALDRIESAAVLEPRALRDGDGQRVEQPSPANGAD